jgi:hypothetical protein
VFNCLTLVSHFIWRPQLKDPADEMVLEAAVNGHAEGIVTFNRRDCGLAPVGAAGSRATISAESRRSAIPE